MKENLLYTINLIRPRATVAPTIAVGPRITVRIIIDVLHSIISLILYLFILYNNPF
jgi:hypothetical protein